MSMKEMRYRFSDFPVRYDRDDYDAVRNRYLLRVARIADVKAMYQVGTISAPGLSDIDLVIVLNDTLRCSSAKDYSISALGEKAKYLFMHNPMIINQGIFGDFSLFPFADHLKLIKVVNKTVTLKNISVKSVPVNRIADVVDNMGSLLRRFTFILVSGRCPMRSTLARLNALCMNIADFKNITGKSNPSWDEFCEQVKILRKGWFFLKEADQKEQVICFLKKALSISYELGCYLQDYLTDAGYITPLYPKEPLIDRQSFLRFSVFSKYSGMHMVDMWRKLAGSLNAHQTTPYKLFFVFLPFAFYAQWACYSEGKGKFSRTFKKYLPFSRELSGMIKSVTYRGFLLRRIQFLDNQIAFLKAHKFYYGLLAQPPIKPFFYGAKRSSIRRIVRYPIELFIGDNNRRRLDKALRSFKSNELCHI